MVLGTDIHTAPGMSPYDFGDPLTFLVVPPAGQSLQNVKYLDIYWIIWHRHAWFPDSVS